MQPFPIMSSTSPSTTFREPFLRAVVDGRVCVLPGDDFECTIYSVCYPCDPYLDSFVGVKVEGSQPDLAILLAAFHAMDGCRRAGKREMRVETSSRRAAFILNNVAPLVEGCCLVSFEPLGFLPPTQEELATIYSLYVRSRTYTEHMEAVVKPGEEVRYAVARLLEDFFDAIRGRMECGPRRGVIPFPPISSPINLPFNCSCGDYLMCKSREQLPYLPHLGKEAEVESRVLPE